jgi:hypothetical protein
VVRLVIKGSVEEHILHVAQEKRRLTDSSITGTTALFNAFFSRLMHCGHRRVEAVEEHMLHVSHTKRRLTDSSITGTTALFVTFFRFMHCDCITVEAVEEHILLVAQEKRQLRNRYYCTIRYGFCFMHCGHRTEEE